MLQPKNGLTNCFLALLFFRSALRLLLFQYYFLQPALMHNLMFFGPMPSIVWNLFEMLYIGEAM